jgi:dephospho-CoA kinase
MFKIGLTGGIASGKTSVAKWFADKGITVFDADKIVHELLSKPFMISKINEEFGSRYIENGKINRTHLAKKIFNDPWAKNKLEGIIHPFVLKEMMERCRISELKNEKLIILDIPLLLEKDWDKYVDEVWVVYVSLSIQIQRLMQRNELIMEDAKQRIFSQMLLDEKIKKADRVIDNSASWGATEKQLSLIWEELKIKN